MEIDKPLEPPRVMTPTPQDNYLVMQGEPDKQLEFGRKCASALMQVVSNKPKKVMINGEQYLEYEDWQTLGRFFGITVGTDWTKEVLREGKLVGYEAKAVVLRNTEIISSAEAMCLRSEKNWANRDEFALRSMAQTRACAKALRNVLAWVAVLAGVKPTPVEEMPSDMEVSYVPVEKPKSSVAKPNAAGILYEPPPSPQGVNCSNNCGAVCEDIVAKYSQDFYGRILCRDCQKQFKRIK